MQFTPTKIPEVIMITPTVFSDTRGYFMETFQQHKFIEAGLSIQLVQDNLSFSQQGVLRGLHYQIQQPQGKLVKVVVGEVFDVAVDMRRSSPTFGQWVGMILSAQNHQQLWIPPGFAHGFYVLSENATVVYSCSDFYMPQAERTLLWNDPDIAIAWPLASMQPLLSPKDAQGIAFKQAEFYA